MSAKRTKQIFPVTGMSCAGCSSSIESMLKAQPGVFDAGVNLANQTAWIDYNEDEINSTKIQEVVRSIGYDLIIDTINSEVKANEIREKNLHSLKLKTILSAIVTIPIVFLSMVFMNWEPSKWISLALSTIVIFWFGRGFFRNALKQTMHFKANMDTLVALSTSIAYIFSLFNTIYPDFWMSRGIHPHVYFESASVIITFILLGKWLEERAKGKTSSSIKKLMGLQPDTVTVVRGNDYAEIKALSLVVGDIVIVKPGARIPVDGSVIEGSSYVDESSITGEPVPVLKQQGDKVYSGTSNQKGSFRIKAEQVGSETVLSKIIKMVEEAQGSKAPIQKLADRIAGIFVPSVLGIAIITFLLWVLLGGEQGAIHGLQAMVTVLAIACPCALGLATPTAIMVGVGRGAENSILIKDAECLEIGHKINTVVLDKTGTITEGRPEVQGMEWYQNIDIELQKSVLYTIESHSEHPLAEAVTRYLKSEKITSITLDNFQALPGQGVYADYMGSKYVVGGQNFLRSNNIVLPEFYALPVEKWINLNHSIVYFIKDLSVIAVIAIADRIKANAAEAINSLKDMGIDSIMLTGDSPSTAEAVSKQVGIESYRAHLLPSDKADAVKELQKNGRFVAMVGDGINDSQALALADISIAMGKGSDIAMDIAKITIMNSDINLIPKAIKLSKVTMKIVKQNLFWAFIYNIIGIPIAAGILYPFFGFQFDPMIAGVAMAMSSVSVVSNSLRLKRISL